jgi:7-cyano-7-deazaguanine synthase
MTTVASPREALVLCSGGQDSTTCLAWARRRFAAVHTVAFDYGQRHRIELQAAARIAALAGVRSHRVLTVEALKDLGGSSLTADIPVDAESPADGLPNSFVPGRNLLFLTLAAAWAWQLGVTDLVTGVCQTDYSGYPDCRQDTMDALQAALRAGMAAPFTIHTPLMHLTKAQTVHLARDEDGLELLAHSHTCYNGAIPPCGSCPACHLRAKGFAEAGIADPLLTRLGH